MKKYLVKAVSLLLIAVMGFGFTACHKKKKTIPYGGVARVGITEAPVCLDPHKASTVCEKEILVNIFDTLYRFNSKGELKPCLASDVSISPDARTYTFTLKENILFSDGSELDTGDVVYSIKRAAGLLPDQDGTALIPELDSVISVTASELQVTVTLDSPDSELIALYETAIIPEGCDDIETSMIGSGPFKFVSYTEGDELTLERNENYRNPKYPYLDGVVFKIFPDINSAYAALLDETIDILPYITGFQALMLDTSRFRIQSKASNSVQMFAFNNNSEYLSDERIRQAISYTIDRDEIISRCTNGRGEELTTGMSTIMVEAYNPSVNGTYARDLVTARALMEQAGYSRGFSLTVLVPSDDQLQIDTAMIIAQQLREINITLHVEVTDPETFNTRVFETHDYEAALLTLTGEFDPYNIVSDYGTYSEANFIGYSNSLVDLRLQQIPLTADPNDRLALYHETLYYMTNDACSCYIQDPHFLFATNKKFAGVRIYPNHVLNMFSVHLK